MGLWTGDVVWMVVHRWQSHFSLSLSLSKRIKKVIWLCGAAVVLSLNENLGSVQIPTLICSFDDVMSSSPSLNSNASPCFPFSEVCLCNPNCAASMEEISPILFSLSPSLSVSSISSAGVLNSPLYAASPSVPLHEQLMRGKKRIMEIGRGGNKEKQNNSGIEAKK